MSGILSFKILADLYSQTLNLLGTGVTYCQGDLGNVESLEYALTDVDKIVFCAGAPRPDETDFQEKFKYFIEENLSPNKNVTDAVGKEDENANDEDWEKLSSVLDVRSQLAEQVDCIGMQNLVAAYQNVRHADYGTFFLGLYVSNCISQKCSQTLKYHFSKFFLFPG